MATSIHQVGAPSPGAMWDYTRAFKGINYYPARNSWDSMWLNFPTVPINNDMVTISGWGFNVVRLIIRTATFGYPTPTSTMMGYLDTCVRVATAAGLRVQLTLFDAPPAGTYTDIAGSQTWCSAVVAPYAGDKRVAMIELQNEVNTLDTQRFPWSKTMLGYLRSVAGGTPITVSVSGSTSGGGGIAGLKRMVGTYGTAGPDFYSLHMYPADWPMTAYDTMATGLATVAPAPLIIGETGVSTYNQLGFSGYPSGQGIYEAWQDFYYRTLLYHSHLLDLPPPFPWIHSDFDGVSADMQGGPSSNPSEWYFGLIRLDGSAKPALSAFQAYLAHSTVSMEQNLSFDIIVNSDSGPFPAYACQYRPDLGTMSYDQTVTHGMSSGASVSIRNSISDPAGVCSWLIKPIIPIHQSKTYTASVWVQGFMTTGTNNISIAWYDSNRSYFSQSISPNLSAGTQPWTLLTASGIPPAGATVAIINLRSDSNSGTVWFDDVTFTEG